ncbi:hypothetical protein ACH49_30855, partial [Streptomyces leeuwenhoekii]
MKRSGPTAAVRPIPWWHTPVRALEALDERTAGPRWYRRPAAGARGRRRGPRVRGKDPRRRRPVRRRPGGHRHQRP